VVCSNKTPCLDLVGIRGSVNYGELRFEGTGEQTCHHRGSSDGLLLFRKMNSPPCVSSAAGMVI
jgi:hypothetical protein